LFPDIGLDDMRMLGGNASDILQKFQTESRQLIDILQARHFICHNLKIYVNILCGLDPARFLPDSDSTFQIILDPGAILHIFHISM
jgi:hypothetical protein